MTTKWLVLLLLAIAATTAGCSSKTSTASSAAATPKTVAAAMTTAPASLVPPANLPAEPAPPGLPSAQAEAGLPTPDALPVSPFPEMGDLFAPPKIVVPVVSKEPEPEPKTEVAPAPDAPKNEKALPHLRLIGFVEVEGLKALLAVEGELKVVTIGDSTDGLRIIAIEPPAITLKHTEDGQEIQMNLFDQPWFHSPTALSGERRSYGGKPVIQKGSSASPPPHFGAPPLPPPSPPLPDGGSTRSGMIDSAPRVPGMRSVEANGPPHLPGFGGPGGPPGIPGAPGPRPGNIP